MVHLSHLVTWWVWHFPRHDKRLYLMSHSCLTLSEPSDVPRRSSVSGEEFSAAEGISLWNPRVLYHDSWFGVWTETPHSALICCRSLVNHWVFLTHNWNCRAASATVWTYCRVLSYSGSCSKFTTFCILQQMNQGSVSKCGVSCLQNPKMFTKHGPSFLAVESTGAINFPDLGGDVLPCPRSLDP